MNYPLLQSALDDLIHCLLKEYFPNESPKFFISKIEHLMGKLSTLSTKIALTTVLAARHNITHRDSYASSINVRMLMESIKDLLSYLSTVNRDDSLYFHLLLSWLEEEASWQKEEMYSVESLAESIVFISSFEEIKNDATWRQEIHGKYLLIHTGKHAGKIVKFRSWNGSRVHLHPLMKYVRDADNSDMTVPSKVYVSILTGRQPKVSPTRISFSWDNALISSSLFYIIEKMVRKMLPWKESGTYQENIIHLLSIADTNFRKVALKTLLHNEPKNDYTCILNLLESLNCLSAWYVSVFPISSLLKGEGERILDILIAWFSRRLRFQRNGAKEDFQSRGIMGIYHEESSQIEIEMEGTLRDLKESEWREKIKKRKLRLNTGKHTDRIGLFRSWQGSRAWIRFDNDMEDTAIPLDQSVSILKY